jgi:hypothetical protein
MSNSSGIVSKVWNYGQSTQLYLADSLVDAALHPTL